MLAERPYLVPGAPLPVVADDTVPNTLDVSEDSPACALVSGQIPRGAIGRLSLSAVSRVSEQRNNTP